MSAPLRPVASQHRPVMLEEVATGLSPRHDGAYLDATVGGGGHALRIMAQAERGRMLAIDADLRALDRARLCLATFAPRVTFVHGSFARLREHADTAGFTEFDGVLFDLGISSDQLDDPARGLSFRLDGPLDMRMDESRGVTAAELVNGLPEHELADLIHAYGEEWRSRRIARAIVAARPLASTADLAEAVVRATGRAGGRIHPATRTFQAIRIAVNDELRALELALPQAIDLLAPLGRMACISFHSLEDRIVKHALRDASRDCICPPGLPECRCTHRATVRLLTRRPMTPTTRESESNPRARSARLRLAERVAPQ